MAIERLFQAVFPCTLFSAGWVVKSCFKNVFNRLVNGAVY